MAAGSIRSGPEPSSLVRGLDRLLGEFVHTDLTYLTPGGRWQTNPVSLRDRASNELLFRLWQSRNELNWAAPAVALFAPLAADGEIWNLAVRNALSGGGPPDESDALLASVEMLVGLVEYETYLSCAGAYVADWDYAARARLKVCEDRAARALERLVGGSEVLGRRLAAVAGSIEAAGRAVFDRTVTTLAEEETVRWRLQGLAATGGDASAGGPDLGIPDDDLRQLIPFTPQTGDALVRLGIEILLRKDLDVSTGIQYQVSDLLGRVADPRTMEGMLAALASFEPRHTGIRANIVYALGRLREKHCLDRFEAILGCPESVRVETPTGPGYMQSLHSEKCEAIWAIGKLGADASASVHALAGCVETPDRDIRLHLAWALGEIGSGQKESSGGVDSDVVVALMRLLGQADGGLYEEAASALKKLGLPEFLHGLHLHDSRTLPVLSLKPSSTGLYELSETILHLASVKRPVVMAVTGDSGTGKTYFCETIAEGFAGVAAHEIVYLMRDRVGDRTLDRIVGLEWLRSHVEPRFYDPYPVPEEQDAPDAYFDELLDRHREKKLLILDGWRDQAYFNRVIEVFYEKGYLDLIVHFGTTFSTRRLNLEEREVSLERVKLHLPLVEAPVIEETNFYREGSVLVYNLDNSIESRLDRTGIREIFNRRKVDRWGDQIRIGAFVTGARHLAYKDGRVEVAPAQIEPSRETIRSGDVQAFKSRETSFTRMLNDDLAARPHLLQTVKTRDIPVKRIAFHTQGQIAFCGYDGSVGVLVGFSDRVFSTRPHDSGMDCLAVVGRDIYAAGGDGKIFAVSFDRNTTTEVAALGSPVISLAAHRDGRLVSGHLDGSVRIWNTRAGTVDVARLHEGPVTTVAMDRQGRIYSGGTDGMVKFIDGTMTSAVSMALPGLSVKAVSPYVNGRLVVATGRSDEPGPERHHTATEILLLRPADGRIRSLQMSGVAALSAVSVYFDGRFMIAFTPSGTGVPGGGVAVVDPRPGGAVFTVLGGHGAEARDCLTMGPRIVSCGSESENEHTLKIWGTASYVAAEHAKASFMPESMPKPPYYRSIF